MTPATTDFSEKAASIADILNRLYPNPPIPLKHEDAYTLLIAVLLSAQCTDERVNKVTPMLFDRAKTPAKMVTLAVADIQEIIRPCGLSPRKSKAIYELSQILLDKFDGEVPATFEDLEA
ncbi:MAG: endonuclease III, partial [Calditrichia bacterium]